MQDLLSAAAATWQDMGFCQACQACQAWWHQLQHLGVYGRFQPVEHGFEWHMDLSERNVVRTCPKGTSSFRRQERKKQWFGATGLVASLLLVAMPGAPSSKLDYSSFKLGPFHFDVSRFTCCRISHEIVQTKQKTTRECVLFHCSLSFVLFE